MKNNSLDGYIYPDSDITEWKLEFHDHTFIGEFSTADVSFGCKGKAAKT